MIHKYSLLLFLIVIHFLMLGMAASYYVSPNGQGGACSQAAPCSLNTGIDKAGGGDEVVLKDGTYRQFLRFKRSGRPGQPIVVRAENPHQAVIELPNGVKDGKGGGRNSVINTTKYSHITIRELSVDGRDGGEDGISAKSPSGNPSNIIIENNLIRNTGSSGIGLLGVSNVIVRFNRIEDTGNSHLGEGMYVGHSKGKYPVRNVEIYGNVIRNARHNFVDLKRGNENVFVHHNIFEQMQPSRARPELGASDSSDGLILMGENVNGRSSRVENNIIYNVTGDTTGQPLKVSQNSGHIVQNNVFYNIRNKHMISGHQQGKSGKTSISNNTFCALASYAVNDTAGPIGGVDIQNNKVNAPLAACKAEEDRILAEIKQLGLSPNKK